MRLEKLSMHVRNPSTVKGYKEKLSLSGKPSPQRFVQLRKEEASSEPRAVLQSKRKGDIYIYILVQCSAIQCRESHFSAFLYRAVKCNSKLQCISVNICAVYFNALKEAGGWGSVHPREGRLPKKWLNLG